MDLQKRYADDEDFQLTPAQAAQLLAQQAAELEDADTPPPAIVPRPLPSQQTTPVHSAIKRQPLQSVPAAAALQTSASMPAAGGASMPAAGGASTPAAAQGRAAEHEALLRSGATALLQAASVPLTGPLHTAPATSAAKAGRTQANADVAQAANALPGHLKRTPQSPVQRPSQELHPAASGSAVTAAGAAFPAVATGAADAATATAAGSGGGAPSAALSGGQSQKSGDKVWLPPAALASPQRSSGKTITACKPETLYRSKVCLVSSITTSAPGQQGWLLALPPPTHPPSSVLPQQPCKGVCLLYMLTLQLECGHKYMHPFLQL